MRNLFAILLTFAMLQVVIGQVICAKGNFYSLRRRGCEECPVGTFANGTVPLSECESCQPGETTYFKGKSECFKCPAGTFSKNGSNCENCPSGTYFAGIGAKDISECIACPAGETAWLSGAKECKKCSAGTFEVNRTNCFSCPSGTSSNAGAKNKSECIPCEPGYIASPAGSQCT